jgi:hypothetical protein
VEIESSEKSSLPCGSSEITAKGVDALAKAISPSRNKGEVFLFNDRSLVLQTRTPTSWYRASALRAKLPMATGDHNDSRDYTPTALPDE